MTISVENAVSGLGANNNVSQLIIGTNTGTAYSNSGTNRVVVLHIGLTVAGTTPASVSSITSPNLTWTKRNSVNCIQAADTTSVETWWAFASAQVSSEHITVNFNNLPKCVAMHIFSVVGCNTPSSPWDSDASLPGSGANTTTSNTTPQNLSPISFGDTDPLLIYVQATRNPSFTQTPPTGFTQIGPTNQEPGAGSDRCYMVSGYKANGSPASSQTYSGTPSEQLWVMDVDVLAGGATPPPRPPTSSAVVLS